MIYNGVQQLVSSIFGHCSSVLQCFKCGRAPFIDSFSRSLLSENCWVEIYMLTYYIATAPRKELIVLRLGVCGALYANANICTYFDTNKTCMLMSDYDRLVVVIVEEHTRRRFPTSSLSSYFNHFLENLLTQLRYLTIIASLSVPDIIKLQSIRLPRHPCRSL